MASSPSARFDRFMDIGKTRPTLIEGLPGHGLVASIAVDQITQQLELSHYGSIIADDFPPVVTFQDGLVRDLVRVYAGRDPAVMTLQSDLAIPQVAFEPLGNCVLNELAEEFDRAIFLAGAPAENEAQIGTVTGIATTDAIRSTLESADIQLADNPGVVGGVTGALVKECYHADVPAALLIVRSHPFLPDPGAAEAVIEQALEPLVEFDIDTSALREQSDEIRDRMAQIASQYEQVAKEEGRAAQSPSPSMYQ